MRKEFIFIAAICLLIYIAGIMDIMPISKSWTYFSGFIAFLLLTISAVTVLLKSERNNK
jgi:hypothetical protein